MHVDDQSEIVDAHFGEALVAQDACVVDENVDASPRTLRLVNHRTHRGLVGHRTPNRQRLAAVRDDFGGNLLGSGDREVVHDDARALFGEVERMRAAQSAPGTGDDRDPAVQRQFVMSHINLHSLSSELIY